MGWLIFDVLVFCGGYAAAIYTWEWLKPILIDIKNLFAKPPGA